jgi:glycosyltransferase involved in cell wall biosynthesis
MNIKRSFLGVLRYCFSRNYRNFRFVRQLSIFDADYYINQVKDDCCGGANDPLWRYLVTRCRGCSLRRPSGSHWQHSPDPHPLFDTSFYITQYFPKGLRDNPFAHYLKKGWKKGYQPGPFFNPEVYKARSTWQKSDGDPLTHYTHHGARDCISPGLYFDIDWYLDKNPVLDDARNHIVRHYKLYGAKEGKSPVPVFDPDYYLKQLDAPEEARQDPISHYIATAGHGTSRPCELFDPDFYGRQCEPEVHRSLALAHYLSEGVFRQVYCEERIQLLAKKPVISIIVPVYNPEPCFLNSCIRSVLYQAYPHWELCLADDCSSGEEIKELLGEWTRKDKRIKVTFLEKNSGISAATNAAASMAEGEYLGFLDNDDELTLDCLYYIAETISRKEVDLIYTDEDLIGDDGRRFSVFRKPDFNLELLLSHNYITHFVVVSKALFEMVGGLDSRYDGAQDFDLMLKLTEQTDRTCHIPRVLYHWRAATTSTSINHDQKDYAHGAGRRALEAALARRKNDAVVEDTDINFFYRLRYNPEQNKKISLFFWSDSFSEHDVSRIISLIQETTYPNIGVLFVSDDPDVSRRIAENISDPSLLKRVTHHCVAAGLGKAHALHLAALSCDSDLLGFVDSSITGVERDWLEQLLGAMSSGLTGIACGRVFHNGGDGPTYTVPDISDDSDEYFHAFLHCSTLHMNGLHCPQQVRYCRWGVTLVERSLYLEVNGFDYKQFPDLLAMLDLSLKVAERGRRIVYTPYARVVKSAVIHPGNPHNQAVGEMGKNAEKIRFQQKWQDTLQCIDPFYNQEILADNNISREHFLNWQAGGEQG